MTNSKTSPAYTAGLWSIAGQSSNDGESFIIESSTRTIAWTARSLNSEGREETTPEDEANAHLIAAAPELLEALKESMQYDTSSTPDDIARRKGYRAIIAKAHGKAA